MRELLLTLGHNSSAILIEDGEIQWGYETERLTGVKSDSRFPMPYLAAAGIQVGKVDVAHVVHWSPDGRLNSMSEKHWNPAYGLEGVPVHTLDVMGRSHHDAHMAAALCYADGGERRFPREGSIGVVIDGFGIVGEHFSVYDLSGPMPRLMHRVHGYNTSLGLWYQYATAFMGMKMHEDEYKLLGYEAHVEPERWAEITNYAGEIAGTWRHDMRTSVYGSEYDPLYDVKALPNVKEYVFKMLNKACTHLNITNVGEFVGRSELSVFVQSVLEQVVCAEIDRFKPKNLVLSGGVFYNVKLGKRLMEQVDGVTCVYPLAGDQGNGIGLYAMTHPNWKFPADLNWGKRVLRNVGSVPNMTVIDEGNAYNKIRDALYHSGSVNLVRGNMEFGPRSLCNTSTLALPTTKNVGIINGMNERNTVMPMAPVMTRGMYRETFENVHKVWRSHKHMVIAMEHVEYPLENIMGVVHEYPAPHMHHTSRPQVVDESDQFMFALLNEFGGVLINTSFNFHGKPIAWGMPEVIDNHLDQLRRNQFIQTVVVQNV